MKIKKRMLNLALMFFTVLFVFLSIILGASLIPSGVMGANITNITVTTKVNVTNTEPNTYSVVIDPSSINLDAGTYVNVICNASVFELNGWEDITNVQGILYDITEGGTGSADNNYRYINSSCDYNSSQTCISKDGEANNASCVCTFPVQYYANNGSWQCNVTAIDSFGLNSTNVSAIATMNTVLGIDAPLEIDFGNLSVTETSASIRENITNFGNVPLNVTVRGFGGSVETVNTRNLSMVCNTEGSLNITPSYERYALANSTPFANMFNISNTSRMLDLTIPVREDEVGHGNATNATFWRLQIPFGVSGFCNGTVIFGAVEEI